MNNINHRAKIRVIEIALAEGLGAPALGLCPPSLIARAL